MDDREWMYTDRVERNDVTPEWIRKIDNFVEWAYGEAAKGASLVPCPCNMCQQKRTNKEDHGRTYLEEWIYVGLYSVDISW